jgi:ferredoxin-NADP reductase
MEYKVKVLDTAMVTHNVKRFVVEKPPGYHFISGQATDVSINKPGLEADLRPFTFTSVNDAEHLEFIIKIYSDHDGMTSKLADITAGDELIIHDVFGTITYKGCGLFIAGGAGITPFISIFRDLKQRSTLHGNTLVFANRTDADVILKEELQQMLGGSFKSIIEESDNPSIPAQYIDRDILKPYVNDDSNYYYICGTDGFTKAMVGHLFDLGVKETQFVIEQ